LVREAFTARSGHDTLNSLYGVMEKIPTDRVTDGIDQTSLLLNGEGHSRRNYIVHYSGANIGAVRYDDFKAVVCGGVGGGLPCPLGAIVKSGV